MSQSLEAAASRAFPLPGEARRKLLVVDDDMLALRALDKTLRAQEFEVFTAPSVEQARQLIDRADLDEEQKQKILLAMSCPCCGGGAISFTAKLRR